MPTPLHGQCKTPGGKLVAVGVRVAVCRRCAVTVAESIVARDTFFGNHDVLPAGVH